MKEAIKENSNFLAIWTMWEPNAYDAMDNVYAGDSLHDQKGNFAFAYYFDDHILKSEINDTLDYLEDFYTIPARVKKPIIRALLLSIPRKREDILRNFAGKSYYRKRAFSGSNWHRHRPSCSSR